MTAPQCEQVLTLLSGISTFTVLTFVVVLLVGMIYVLRGLK